MYKGVKEIKVAGVTFNNKDGVPVRSFCASLIEKRLWRFRFWSMSNKGKPAFHVLVNGKIIGNIPKDKAPFIVRNRKGIAFDDIEIAIYQDKKGENYGAGGVYPLRSR